MQIRMAIMSLTLFPTRPRLAEMLPRCDGQLWRLLPSLRRLQPPVQGRSVSLKAGPTPGLSFWPRGFWPSFWPVRLRATRRRAITL